MRCQRHAFPPQSRILIRQCSAADLLVIDGPFDVDCWILQSPRHNIQQFAPIRTPPPRFLRTEPPTVQWLSPGVNDTGIPNRPPVACSPRKSTHRSIWRRAMTDDPVPSDAMRLRCDECGESL